MTRALPAPPTLVPPLFPHAGDEVFGTLFAEVLTPEGGVSAPCLPDWELRAWPVARLGDATVEARPRRAGLGAAHLDHALRRAGYTPLGPIHPVRR